MIFDYTVIWENLPLYISGVGVTLKILLISLACGLALAIPLGLMRVSKSPLVNFPAWLYTYVIRGTPMLVQLFLIYYGLPQWGVRMSPFTVAFIGFTLNVAAYNAAYLTTAFNGMDATELEAAHAQGFSDGQVFRYITLPQVLRLSVPALTNQVIGNLKDSSVAFLIQYTEFFARVQELAATNFQFFKAYLFAALVYLAIVSLIVVIARMIEKRICIIG